MHMALCVRVWECGAYLVRIGLRGAEASVKMCDLFACTRW
jgi:hypothetical protein